MEAGADARLKWNLQNLAQGLNGLVEMLGARLAAGGPGQAVVPGDFSDIPLAQRWPGFQERSHSFLAVSRGARAERGVTVQTLPINPQGVGEGHLALDAAGGTLRRLAFGR